MNDQDRIVVYARGYRAPDLHRRFYVPIFHDPQVARGWLDFFLENEEYRRDGNTLHLDSGITLKSDQLDRVLRANGVDVSSQDERRILRFKHGTWDEVHTRATAIAEKSPKVEREHRPERPTGFVTITELCAGSDVLPMHARAALRASGRTKPPYGWAFAPSEVEAIKQICGIK